MSPLSDDDTTQFAAGVLPWRIGKNGDLEVLLIHRPRYDDWSWPKGKVDRGESLAQCALREGAEETGLTLVLGRPLATVKYTINGGKRKKEVHYWAARQATREDKYALRARDPIRDADPTEVDKMRWMSAASAVKKLTRRADRRPLDDLTAAFKAGHLDTRALVVVRHARARKRSTWPADEETRPLTPTGRGQAHGVVPVLSAYGVIEVTTSPWQRCLDTIEPYCRETGLFAIADDGITEAGHAESPKRARQAVKGTLNAFLNAAICTHRPVLPTLVKVLAKASTPSVSKRLPKKDPYLRPGHMLIAHIAAAPDGPVVVAVEKHAPVV